jgi:hypothetical protein
MSTTPPESPDPFSAIKERLRKTDGCQAAIGGLRGYFKDLPASRSFWPVFALVEAATELPSDIWTLLEAVQEKDAEIARLRAMLHMSDHGGVADCNECDDAARTILRLKDSKADA